MKLILILLSIYTAWGSEDGVFVREYGLERPRILLHTDKWGVLPDSVDHDKYSFKDQPRHIVDWERLDAYSWLDFYYWKAQRQVRDKYPDWRLRMRDSSYTEKIGQVIQCVSQCQLFKTEQGTFSQYMSRIHEGDEIVTGDDSYAWIVLVDGTLLRISPNTSVSFNDVNISFEKSQFVLRLNYGHVYFQPRLNGKFQPQNLAESDGLFLPLLVKNANREYYIRKEFQSLLDQEMLHYEILKNSGYKGQYAALNKLVSPTEQSYLRDSSIILAVANTTTVIKNAPFEIWHGSFNISLMKKYGEIAGFEREDSRESAVTAYYRGYNNRESLQLEDDLWYQVDIHGKQISEADISKHKIAATEIFVRRIPSIQLAREHFLRTNYQFNFWDKDAWSEEKLAVDYGHRLWSVTDKDELQKRHDYLLEFIRRTETANLRSVDKLQYKYSNDLFDDSYIKHAIAANLKYLKRIGSLKAAMIKEMTDTQYYVWMLKYGKKHYETYTSKCLATKAGAASMDLSSVPSTDC